MTDEIPGDAICAACGHDHDTHLAAAYAGLGPCMACLMGGDCPGFKVQRFAGGAYSPDAERKAYERALRGE